MSDDLAALYEVQQADTEIARLKQELSGLDTGEELEAEIAAAEAELNALREQHRLTGNESADRDLELKTLEEKRDRYQRQLYGGSVSNPRQLADLQGEVGMLSREIGKVEDRMLELMEALERQRADLQAGEQRLAEMRERVREVQAEFQKASDRLRGGIAGLEGRRKGAAQRVAPQVLKRYEQIRARQNNIGLVKVAGNTCPACRIAFPSDTLKNLKAGRPNLTCDSCGRLLYWDGSSD